MEDSPLEDCDHTQRMVGENRIVGENGKLGAQGITGKKILWREEKNLFGVLPLPFP